MTDSGSLDEGLHVRELQGCMRKNERLLVKNKGYEWHTCSLINTTKIGELCPHL